MRSLITFILCFSLISCQSLANKARPYLQGTDGGYSEDGSDRGWRTPGTKKAEIMGVQVLACLESIKKVALARLRNEQKDMEREDAERLALLGDKPSAAMVANYLLYKANKSLAKIAEMVLTHQHAERLAAIGEPIKTDTEQCEALSYSHYKIITQKKRHELYTAAIQLGEKIIPFATLFGLGWAFSHEIGAHGAIIGKPTPNIITTTTTTQ